MGGKNTGGPFSICDSITLPNLGACSICAQFENVNLAGDLVNFCPKINVSCPASLKQSDVISFPSCLNISGCSPLGCKNLPWLTTTGSCLCPPPRLGPDCSVIFAGNCIEKITTEYSLLNQACWVIGVEGCKFYLIDTYGLQGSHLATQINTTVGTPVIALTPPKTCLSITNSCQLCVYAENLQFQYTSLVGCPYVQLECGGVTLAKYAQNCTNFMNSFTRCNMSTSVITGVSQSSSGHSASSTASCSSSSITTEGILGVIVVILVIGVILVGGYLVYQRYQANRVNAGFQQVPTEFEEDIAENMEGEGDVGLLDEDSDEEPQ